LVLGRFLAPPPERFGAQEASFFARWFCFSSGATPIRRPAAAEKWPDLRTILFILCFLLFNRQVVPINTDFWRA